VVSALPTSALPNFSRICFPAFFLRKFTQSDVSLEPCRRQLYLAVGSCLRRLLQQYRVYPPGWSPAAHALGYAQQLGGSSTPSPTGTGSGASGGRVLCSCTDGKAKWPSSFQAAPQVRALAASSTVSSEAAAGWAHSSSSVCWQVAQGALVPHYLLTLPPALPATADEVLIEDGQ
jgi:hypothetical protein